MKVDKGARKFVKEYELTHPIKASDIERIIKHQGFRVVRYNDDENDEATKLINHLKLREYTRLVNCFTYFDNKYKILFIREGLSAEDEKLLFLHEEGHIYLNHFHADNTILSTGITKEQEAHRFAEYVQKYAKIRSRTKSLFIPASVSLIICSVFLMIYICMPHNSAIFASGGHVSSISEILSISSPNGTWDENTYSEDDNSQSFTVSDSDSVANIDGDHNESDSAIINEDDKCYWTKSGEVYHLYDDCQHIKNSSSVFTGTVSDSGKERVCRTCYSRYILEKYEESN